jgi:hypothetical protein
MPVWDANRSRIVLSYGRGRVDSPPKPFVQQAMQTRSVLKNSSGGWGDDQLVWSYPGFASLPGPNAGVELHDGRLVFAGWL